MAEVRDRRKERGAEANGRRLDRDGNAPKPRRTHERGETKPETLLQKVERTRRQIEDRRSSYFKPRDGQNRVRILPSWRKGKNQEFYIEVPTHRNIGPGNQWATCLQFWGEKCPVCRAIERLSASESARDQNAASKMMADERYLMNVGVPNTPEGLVKPWSISRTWFVEILGYFSDPDYGNFTHPREGYDYIFTKEGEGLKTRYTNKRFARQPSPIKIPDCKSKLVNLDTFPRRYTRQELLAFLRGEELDT
jgi:hypothetical protein